MPSADGPSALPPRAATLTPVTRATAGRPNPWRTWAADVQNVVAAAAWVGLVTEASFTLLYGDPWSWADALVHGAWFGALLVVALVVHTAVSDEAVARRAVRHAISAGALPVTVVPVEWGPLLRRERARLEFGRWFLPLILVIQAGLLAAVAATTAAVQDVWFLWLLAAAAASRAAAARSLVGRRLLVVDRLQIEIAQQASTPHQVSSAP